MQKDLNFSAVTLTLQILGKINNIIRENRIRDGRNT